MLGVSHCSGVSSGALPRFQTISCSLPQNAQDMSNSLYAESPILSRKLGH
jgi:hypothetical protein